jgi:hypothetical protein
MKKGYLVQMNGRHKMSFLSVRKRLHGTLLLITDGSVLLLTFYNKISGIEVAQEKGRCFMSRKQRGCDRFVVGLFFKHPCMHRRS